MKGSSKSVEKEDIEAVCESWGIQLNTLIMNKLKEVYAVFLVFLFA